MLRQQGPQQGTKSQQETAAECGLKEIVAHGVGELFGVLLFVQLQQSLDLGKFRRIHLPLT